MGSKTTLRHAGLRRLRHIPRVKGAWYAVCGAAFLKVVIDFGRKGPTRRTLGWSANCALAVLLFASPALAQDNDPCRAPITGYKVGTVVAGKVAHVIDGDSICLDLGPKGWLEIRLADFYAPESRTREGKAAKEIMRGIALSKDAECVVQYSQGRRVTTSYDRVLAACSIGGRGLATEMRAAGVVEGGNGAKVAR